MINKRKRAFERAVRIKNGEIEQIRCKLELKEKQRETSYKKLIKQQSENIKTKIVKRQQKQEFCIQEYNYQ